jgi:hypothetical protein
VRMGEFVGEDCQAEEWIALQFLRDVKSIFAQATRTWGESRYQTDLH